MGRVGREPIVDNEPHPLHLTANERADVLDLLAPEVGDQRA
jgi:hypothetical protein